LLRWDGEGLLFDPGEGSQRQMLFWRLRHASLFHDTLTGDIAVAADLDAIPVPKRTPS
jgi:ribonuclease BN (tRNA processing enzyme)